MACWHWSFFVEICGDCCSGCCNLSVVDVRCLSSKWRVEKGGRTPALQLDIHPPLSSFLRGLSDGTTQLQAQGLRR
jgi:hypothetical protein